MELNDVLLVFMHTYFERNRRAARIEAFKKTTNEERMGERERKRTVWRIQNLFCQINKPKERKSV